MVREDEKELVGRLVDAVLAEDVEAVRRLASSLEGGPSSLGPRGLAPLHAAASLADPLLLRILLESLDADPDPRSDPDLATPLMVAAAWGRGRVLKELLKAGADPHLADAEGKTTWDYAAGYPECLQLLQEAVEEAWESRERRSYNGFLGLKSGVGSDSEVNHEFSEGQESKVTSDETSTSIRTSTECQEATKDTYELKSVLGFGVSTDWDYQKGEEAWKSRVGPCDPRLSRWTSSEVTGSLYTTEESCGGDTYLDRTPIGRSTPSGLPLSDPRAKVETWLGTTDSEAYGTCKSDSELSRPKGELKRDNSCQTSSSVVLDPNVTTPKGFSSRVHCEVGRTPSGSCPRLGNSPCNVAFGQCCLADLLTPRLPLIRCCCHQACHHQTHNFPCGIHNRPTCFVPALRCSPCCSPNGVGGVQLFPSCHPTPSVVLAPEPAENKKLQELTDSLAKDLTLDPSSRYETPDATSSRYGSLDEAFIGPTVEINITPEEEVYKTPNNSGRPPRSDVSSDDLTDQRQDQDQIYETPDNSRGDLSSESPGVNFRSRNRLDVSDDMFEPAGKSGIVSSNSGSRGGPSLSNNRKQIIDADDGVFKKPCTITKRVKQRPPPELADSDSDSSISLCLLGRDKPKTTCRKGCDSSSSSVCSIVPKRENGNSSGGTCDTDELRRDIIRLWGQCGPLTKTTKPVYKRLYKRLAGSPADIASTVDDIVYSSELVKALGPNGQHVLAKWSSLESEMIKSFESSKKRLGSKVFFNYLLLEPGAVSDFGQFLATIFYVGKGKSDRPYAHLHEALKPDGHAGKKVQRIRDVWESGQGILCLQAFHNVGSQEAFTREASMIDALTLGRLTNAKKGEYHGLVASWCLRDRCRLGSVLLDRCWNVYRAQANRQIYKDDL